MKTFKIIVIAVIIFILLFTLNWIKDIQIKKFESANTELQVRYEILQKEKDVLKDSMKIKKAEYSVLSAQKTTLEIQLAQYKAETNKQIEAFKKTIRDLSTIPSDTVYKNIYSMWSPFDGVLKYRFADSQIRGIYLSILERDHFEKLYSKTNKSLDVCTELNAKNNQVINNLNNQNKNLTSQNAISSSQISNLQDNLNLSKRQLSKQKRRTFFGKLTTVIAATGWVAFAIK